MMIIHRSADAVRHSKISPLRVFRL